MLLDRTLMRGGGLCGCRRQRLQQERHDDTHTHTEEEAGEGMQGEGRNQPDSLKTLALISSNSTAHGETSAALIDIDITYISSGLIMSAMFILCEKTARK